MDVHNADHRAVPIICVNILNLLITTILWRCMELSWTAGATQG